MTAAPLREGAYQAARARPSLVCSVTSSYARPRSVGATSARGRCVARMPIATGTTSQYATEDCCQSDRPLGASSEGGQACASARAPPRRVRAALRRPEGAGTRSSPRRGRPRLRRPRSRAPLPRARGARRPPRAPPARPRASADRPTTARASTENVARPRNRWSDGAVPGSGAMNESTTACAARIAVAPMNRSRSRRADANAAASRKPLPSSRRAGARVRAHAHLAG